MLSRFGPLCKVKCGRSRKGEEEKSVRGELLAGEREAPESLDSVRQTVLHF